MFGSVRPSVRLSINALTPGPFFYWRSFAKYSKGSSETQGSYIIVFILRDIQNGWAFKMVVLSTGCAITVDHPINIEFIPTSAHRAMAERHHLGRIDSDLY